jgi:hypothetical protein
MIGVPRRNELRFFPVVAILLATGFPAGSYAADPPLPSKSIGKAVQVQGPPVALKPAIEILAPSSMESVTKTSVQKISWRFQQGASAPPVAVARPPAFAAAGPSLKPVNITLQKPGGEKVLAIASGYGKTTFFDWAVPGNLPAGIYAILLETVDRSMTDRRMVSIEEYEPPPPPPPRPGTVDCSGEKRTVCGVVTLPDGLPAAGYRVRAFDSDFGVMDINKDDLMGEGVTDAGGVYRLTYADKAWDGPAALKKSTTTWRPDIYTVVHRKQPNGSWKKVYQDPKIYNDHKLKEGLRIDARITDDGECPVPEKFSTKGFWHGCKCPDGTHKEYTLTKLRGEARCAPGLPPEKECDARGPAYEWVGIDSSHGACIKIGNLALHRQAYYAFMKHVRSGVDFKPLPDWVIQMYQPFFTNILLRNVRIGDSTDKKENTSVTDCTRIVFSPGTTGMIYSQNDPTRRAVASLMLHEISHADQCMAKTANDFGTKRDQYADMWFKDLSPGVLRALAASNFSVSKTQIHDQMPMEVDADDKAGEIILATKFGTPPGTCPPGKFSTRTYRGCRCAAGGKKQYEGTFKSQATCR